VTSARPHATLLSLWMAISVLFICLPAVAQQSVQQLPDSPVPHRDLELAASSSAAGFQTTDAFDSASATALPDGLEGTTPPPVPVPLTLRQRFMLQAHTNFAPLALVTPAFESAITMANPPHNYPRDWANGGGAYFRNYGSEVGRHTTAGFAHFAAAAALREDPRYTPSGRKNYLGRIGYAMLFTVVDRSDSGHRTFAASNFIGATAGGFVGMAWVPDGFDDVTHAYQRSAVELTAFASHNLVLEFSPELSRILVKVHLSHAKGALTPTPESINPPETPAEPAAAPNSSNQP